MGGAGDGHLLLAAACAVSVHHGWVHHLLVPHADRCRAGSGYRTGDGGP